jgi:hypothetical protein
MSGAATDPLARLEQLRAKQEKIRRLKARALKSGAGSPRRKWVAAGPAAVVSATRQPAVNPLQALQGGVPSADVGEVASPREEPPQPQPQPKQKTSLAVPKPESEPEPEPEPQVAAVLNAADARKPGKVTAADEQYEQDIAAAAATPAPAEAADRDLPRAQRPGGGGSSGNGTQRCAGASQPAPSNRLWVVEPILREGVSVSH